MVTILKENERKREKRREAGRRAEWRIKRNGFSVKAPEGSCEIICLRLPTVPLCWLEGRRISASVISFSRNSSSKRPV